MITDGEGVVTHSVYWLPIVVTIALVAVLVLVVRRQIRAL